MPGSFPLPLSRLLAPNSRLEAAMACGHKSLADRDVAGLSGASAIDPEWVMASWCEGSFNLATKALPEAARSGWATGVSELARLGADPSEPDGSRQGRGKGPSPLAEAVARGDFEVARALVDAGAGLGPKNMVWAACFRAQRAGSKLGVEALVWMRAHGLDLWSDDGRAAECASEFLFAGGICSMRSEAERKFERLLFEGYCGGPNASQALWHHMFTVCGGADKSPWICEKYLREDPIEDSGRALRLLEWALKGGCPEVAKSAAEALPAVIGWAGFGGEALEAAASASIESGDTPSAPGAQRSAVEALWARKGAELGSRPRDLERACFEAMRSGRAEIFEALVLLGPNKPEKVMDRWEGEGAFAARRDQGPRQAARLECTTALMAKVLRDDPVGGDERARALHERFAGKDASAGFGEALARAQSLVLREVPAVPNSTCVGDWGAPQEPGRRPRL